MSQPTGTPTTDNASPRNGRRAALLGAASLASAALAGTAAAQAAVLGVKLMR